MAISESIIPSDWGRVYDTNRLTYVFTSDKYNEPNFQFQFDLRKWNVNGTYIDIGKFNCTATSTGSVEFNPSQIYRNYVSYNFNASTSTLEPANDSFAQFSLTAREFYGTPPVAHNDGIWSKEVGSFPPKVFYNGCQQNIPFDYIALNIDGNKKWVMSGLTSGQFLTDAISYNMDNSDLGFLYFLSDTSSRPTKIRYTVFYPCTGTTYPDPDPIPIVDMPRYFGVSDEINNTPINDQSMPTGCMNIIDLDQVVPPQPIAVCETYNIARGTGATDLTFSYVNCSGATITTTLTSGNLTFNARKNSVVVYEGNYTLLDLGPVIDPSTSGVTINPTYKVCGTVYEYDDFSYTSNNERMWYFPIGPYQVFNYGMIPAHSTDWLYYTIDIVKHTISGNTILNKQPFYVYKKCKDTKYNRTQLCWLNPNGGFDNFTFDRKSESNFKITKETYKRKIATTSQYNYDVYEAGERVFSTNSIEEITLRSNLLTQHESQLIVQLVQSPRVYMIKLYQYNGANYPYAIPVIGIDSDFLYAQKINDKEITAEIKIRYANDKIISND
jgi:hypothetical protein